jgi:hypothetical protein
MGENVMYYSVEEFLDKHFGVIAGILEQAAVEAGGHYAAMSPAARRLNAEHDAVEFIHALSDGRVDRQAARINGARPTNTGLIADDLLRLSRLVEPRFEDYLTQELANHPALRDELLRRLRQVQTSFRASLTGVKIDQVLNHISSQAHRSA